MSAWMTSRVHRSALAQAAAVNGVVEFTEAGKLFDELTRCNRLALHHRYGDPHPDQLESEHREVVEAQLDPNVLLLNIGCWNYQCSEYDAFWKGEEWADQVMDQLQNHLLQCLGFEPTDEGYEKWSQTYRRHNALPWGIDTWDQVLVASDATV